jgi:hypothetical protein
MLFSGILDTQLTVYCTYITVHDRRRLVFSLSSVRLGLLRVNRAVFDRLYCVGKLNFRTALIR